MRARTPFALMTSFWKLAGALSALAALLLAPHQASLVIYNGSPSAPIGFYMRSFGPARIGNYVTVRAADVAGEYASVRGFADDTDRFLKRVVAGSGAHVCAAGVTVSIEGARPLTRLAQDSAGRALPSWTGCRLLSDSELFLLGDGDDSFDARYWGPVRRDAIDGVWRPLRLTGNSSVFEIFIEPKVAGRLNADLDS